MQKIAIMVSPDKNSGNLLQSGIALARLSGKGLLLINAVKAPDSLETAKKNLEELAHEAAITNPDIDVTVSVFRGPDKNFARKISDDLEVIILIADSGKYAQLGHHLRKSPVPYLFINSNISQPVDFSKVVIPVDMRRQNKDSLLWSAFFGRNIGSEITVVPANDKSRESRIEIASHLHSLKKLMAKAEVPLKIVNGNRNSLFIQNEALALAHKSNAGMLIILGSSHITWLDRLIGLPEARIIKKADGLPVLIVNPRRVTYLVCD